MKDWGHVTIDPADMPAIAAALYDGDPLRRGRLWVGLDVAEGTTSGGMLIAALEERLAGMVGKDEDLVRFLGAVRQKRGDTFVAARRAREIKQIELLMREGDHQILKEVKSVRPLNARPNR